MSLVTRRKTGRVWEILVCTVEGKPLFTIECNEEDVMSVSIKLITAKRAKATHA